ncbi:flagellin [Algisphaera agarilytica]|uniref:Flagellin-like hook-associated protein FlgL n=1 Tax=Algisphaera agarilytica TaxID=1385975 RepID=A0A7X0H3P1_9BACT|nr:hypothetical protein [Algisphaera agarilytica]MBB6428681.1 flagellin-like hook-associated protein FlgL [Algisphaera agarilytica]
MSLTLSNVTSTPYHQQRLNREVNSTIQRLNAGVTVRPKDDPAAFIAYELNRSRENQLKTAGINAERAQAFGQTAINGLDQVSAAIDELRSIYAGSHNSATPQTRIDELLATIDAVNDNTQFKGQRLFPGGTITETQGAAPEPVQQTDIPTLGGVQLGYAQGDLSFRSNIYDGEFNLGEFEVKGTSFTASADPGAPSIELGNLGRAVTATDDRTGTGYILYSEESVHTRFGSLPHEYNADHLISVVYEGGQFYFDDNHNLRAFTPRDSDVIIAEVDYTNDTIRGLAGAITPSTPSETDVTSKREVSTPNTFDFNYSTESGATGSLSLSSVSAAALGDADNSLADLGQGGALGFSASNRTRALEVLQAAQQQVDSAKQQAQTFVRNTVGSLDLVNQHNQSTLAAERQRLENRAGQEVAEQARRLLLRSAGQSLVQDAQQAQTDTLLSLIEQTGGSRAGRYSMDSALRSVQGAQQSQLAEALGRYTQEMSQNDPVSLQTETLGNQLDVLG